MTSFESNKILVIKLGALGDFIQALGPMAAIRKHHPNAHITLLTTHPYTELGERCGYFDDIITDKRPKFYNLRGWRSLQKTLMLGKYARIYDLQNNDRSCFYFKLFPKHKRPEWVGTAKGASHRNTSPARTAGHAYDGHVNTLEMVGIKNIEIDTLDWINEDLSDFPLQKPYILFVPGCAPQHPYKRWPADKYAELANMMITENYNIVLIGTDTEKDVTKAIASQCPDILDLTGKTTLLQVAALAKHAGGAIGNDTGPMHMIAPTGCPSLVLFSKHSNPKRHAPLGENVTALQEDHLQNLEAKTVLDKFQTATLRASGAYKLQRH